MPDKWYTGAADNLANLVADCAAFQSLVGVTTQAEALVRCHYTEAADEIAEQNPTAPRPRLIYGNSAGYAWGRTGTSIRLVQRPLWLMLEATPPKTAPTEEEQARWFGELLDSLIDQMLLKGTGEEGHLVIDRIEAKTEMMLVREEDHDGERFWYIALEVL